MKPKIGKQHEKIESQITIMFQDLLQNQSNDYGEAFNHKERDEFLESVNYCRKEIKDALYRIYAVAYNNSCWK